MNHSQAHDYLYCDGSFRDVYALNLSVEQLNRFLDLIRPSLKENSFLVEGRVEVLPSTYAEILKERKKESPLLSIPVGDSTLNCHFFTDNEIELDFVPSHYDDEKNWGALTDFISTLSREMKTEFILTPENTPETIYIRFNPQAEPGEVVNASQPTGLSENHLND